MTKQEKIDWGLRVLIRQWTNEEEDNYCYDFSKAIRDYLHSQGVVIKVNRKLPKLEFPTHIASDSAVGIVGSGYYLKAQQEMLEAGYAAVGPLVKENTEEE